MRQPKVIVVGGGLAGLMATIRVAEAGVPVELFSIVPVKRSHSVCAQGGINAAKNQKGEGDTTQKHFDDTITGGLAGRCITARRLRERRRGSNCFTRWTSRCGGTNPKARLRSGRAGHFCP